MNDENNTNARGSPNHDAVKSERLSPTCAWIVSTLDKYDDCNCKQLASVQISGQWWCEFHAKAVTLQVSGFDGVLLSRVSSEDQADNGYSLPTQIEGCLRYAIINKIRVVPEHVFIEDIGGTIPISERPIQKNALLVLKRGEARAVIVHQVDRLSRDIADLLASVRSWLRSNVEVHSCDIGKIRSELDIVLVIKGWQGSDERVKIIERCTRGRNGKARSGKVVGTGRPPFGYRYSDGCLIIIDEEARIVKLIFAWYVEGDGDGKPLSLKQIARKLSETRIPSPGENKHSYRTRPPGIWATETVNTIIRNETYARIWRYGKHIGKSFGGGLRSVNDQIAVAVQPIIERSLWDRAQYQRGRNKRMSMRNCKKEYLLRGMVFDINGHLMAGRRKRNRCSYYCNHRYSRHPGLEDQCSQKGVDGKWLESIAWEYVMELLMDRGRFESALRNAQEAEKDKFEPKRERLKILTELIADCEKEVAEVARAFAKKSDGAVGRALEVQIREVEARHAALVKEHDELEYALSNHQFTDENINAALEFREDVLAGIHDPNYECKRRVLELVQLQVTIKENQAQVQCLIPTNGGSIKSKTFYRNSAISAREKLT